MQELKSLIFKFYKTKRDQNNQLTNENLNDAEWKPIKRKLLHNVFVHIKYLHSFLLQVKESASRYHELLEGRILQSKSLD